MARDWGPHKPVTREEFARAWDGVKEVAKHVDALKHALGLITTRLKQLDALVGEHAKKLDELDTHKIDA